jgi:SAM-dependent methyltransferase
VGKGHHRGRGGRRISRGSDQLFYREKEIDGVSRRVSEILRHADLRPTDHVLDAGCAEGLITLELAQHVEHVHGFDISAVRIEEAKRLAEERAIANATFEVESVIGYPVEPLSYDVTIFAGVWGSKGVGFAEIDNLLKGTRRQLLAHIQVAENRERVPPMFEVGDRNGFDVLCFPGKIVIAVRRGSGCRIPHLPGVALVPTAFLAEHPIVREAGTVEELHFDEENSSGLPPLETATAKS